MNTEQSFEKEPDGLEQVGWLNRWSEPELSKGKPVTLWPLDSHGDSSTRIAVYRERKDGE